jgi:hypothetical protein
MTTDKSSLFQTKYASYRLQDNYMKHVTLSFTRSEM